MTTNAGENELDRFRSRSGELAIEADLVLRDLECRELEYLLKFHLRNLALLGEKDRAFETSRKIPASRYPIQTPCYHFRKAGHQDWVLEFLCNTEKTGRRANWEFSSAAHDQVEFICKSVPGLTAEEILKQIVALSQFSSLQKLLRWALRHLTQAGNFEPALTIAESIEDPRVNQAFLQIVTSLIGTGKFDDAERLTREIAQWHRQQPEKSESDSVFMQTRRALASAFARLGIAFQTPGDEDRCAVLFREAFAVGSVQAEHIVEGRQFALAKEFLSKCSWEFPEFFCGNFSYDVTHPLNQVALRVNETEFAKDLIQSIESFDHQALGYSALLLANPKRDTTIPDAEIRQLLEHVEMLLPKTTSAIVRGYCAEAIICQYVHLEQIDKAKSLWKEHRDAIDESAQDYKFSIALAEYAVRKIDEGCVDEAISIAESAEFTYSPSKQEIANALIGKGFLDEAIGVVNRSGSEVVVGSVVQTIAEQYSWDIAFDFIRKVTPEREHKSESRLYGVRFVARNEGPERAREVYLWLREQEIDMHHQLLRGLIDNGNLEVASEIVLDLLDRPVACRFPTVIHHGFYKPERLIRYLVEADRLDDAQTVLRSQANRSMTAMEVFVRAVVIQYGLEAIEPFLNPELDELGNNPMLDMAYRKVAATTALIELSDPELTRDANWLLQKSAEATFRAKSHFGSPD